MRYDKVLSEKESKWKICWKHGSFLTHVPLNEAFGTQELSHMSTMVWLQQIVPLWCKLGPHINSDSKCFHSTIFQKTTVQLGILNDCFLLHTISAYKRYSQISHDYNMDNVTTGCTTHSACRAPYVESDCTFFHLGISFHTLML